MTFKETVDALAQHVIDDTQNNDDHFSIIAGVIGNLAQYLADGLE